MHEDRAARRSIAAGAAGFLVIRFETSRQSRMDHRSNVRFVDAHSERDRGNHHFDLAGEKLFLNAPAEVGVKSGMIGHGKQMSIGFQSESGKYPMTGAGRSLGRCSPSL